MYKIMYVDDDGWIRYWDTVAKSENEAIEKFRKYRGRFNIIRIMEVKT